MKYMEDSHRIYFKGVDINDAFSTFPDRYYTWNYNIAANVVVH